MLRTMEADLSAGSGVELFEANRPRLLGLAYRLLGEASEAEDVLQDAFLRWARCDREQLTIPEAWLTTVVTNLCLSRLTSARVRRERYVGPWLPEPVLTDEGTLGPLETVEQRESVSLGMLVLLERLTPPERAVFVLRTAFRHSHARIAEVLGIDEAHSRQLYRRARAHVEERRKRFHADGERRDRLVERFLEATVNGDLAELEKLLAEDVVSWADGGGTVSAARRPVVGRGKVARYLLGLSRHPDFERIITSLAEVNGEPGVLVHEEGRLMAVLVPEVSGGRITALRTVLNPAKLAFALHQLG